LRSTTLGRTSAAPTISSLRGSQMLGRLLAPSARRAGRAPSVTRRRPSATRRLRLRRFPDGWELSPSVCGLTPDEPTPSSHCHALARTARRRKPGGACFAGRRRGAERRRFYEPNGRRVDTAPAEPENGAVPIRFVLNDSYGVGRSETVSCLSECALGEGEDLGRRHGEHKSRTTAFVLKAAVTHLVLPLSVPLCLPGLG
jgi:hypothetical protein